jgi:hypothetical protein
MRMGRMDVAESFVAAGTHEVYTIRRNVETRWSAVQKMSQSLVSLDAVIEKHTEDGEAVTKDTIAKSIKWIRGDVSSFKLWCPGVHAVFNDWGLARESYDPLSFALKFRDAYGADIAGIKAACETEAKTMKESLLSTFQFKTPISDSGCSEEEWLGVLGELDKEKTLLAKRKKELDGAVCTATILENLRRCIDCPVAKRARS